MAYYGVELHNSITVGKIFSIHYFEYMNNFSFAGEAISLQRRCSNNLNQVAIHAHTYGVYPEEIDGLKRS